VTRGAVVPAAVLGTVPAEGIRRRVARDRATVEVAGGSVCGVEELSEAVGAAGNLEVVACPTHAVASPRSARTYEATSEHNAL